MKWPWKGNNKIPKPFRKRPSMAAKVSAALLVFGLFVMINGYDKERGFFQNMTGTVSDIVMLIKPSPETPNKKGKILVCKPIEARSLTINGTSYSENERLQAIAYYILMEPRVAAEVYNENGKTRKALSHGLYPVIEIPHMSAKDAKHYKLRLRQYEKPYQQRCKASWDSIPYKIEL